MILFIVQISAYSSLPYPEILRELNLKNGKSYPFPHAELNFAGFFWFLSSRHWICSPALLNTHSLVQDACSAYHTNDTLSLGKKMCKMRLDSETCSPTAAKNPPQSFLQKQSQKVILSFSINSLWRERTWNTSAILCSSVFFKRK